MDQDAKAWSSGNAVQYYRTHRNSMADLYDSEKEFLRDVVGSSRSVLDIGCAAGGFAAIVRQIKQGIAYTGVDISACMVAEARKRFPTETFSVITGDRLAYDDNFFDASISFGVMHMTSHWPRLLREAWRVSRNDMVFDLRLVEEQGVSDPSISYQRLDFDGQEGEGERVPYIVLNVNEFLSFVRTLEPKAAALKAYGYFHPVSPMTVSPCRQVCMAAFRITKEPNPAADGNLSMEWNLPMSIDHELPVNPAPVGADR